jgi:peptidoglycan/LPS O-acetylase OafA/YrhL
MCGTKVNQSSQPAKQGEKGHTILRVASFDYMRLFAMGLVTVQHALSVTGHYDKTTWQGVNIGQVGVGMFCALSGYLAFWGGLSSPWSWLRRRLEQLFPAYWIVTILSFGLTWFAGTKQISWSLFISQMLGTGYFTHGWDLVNVVSWFISLILLCYLVGAVAKFLKQVRLVLVAVVCLSAGFLFAKEEVDLSRHVLTFALAGLIAYGGMRPKKTFLMTTIFLLLSIFISMQFIYATLGLFLLAVALSWRAPESEPIRLASTYTYEFFLVHGLFLVAFARLMPISAIASVILAVGVAAVTAVLLHRMTKRIYDATATYLWPRPSSV